ncbi:MAG: RnfABCDGE type electron transport complex subunit D [Lachnospiraceae bacterium]|nr:RnfABCDGE type electron transport complex subunit D [Candidatus Equihabitans merdae]
MDYKVERLLVSPTPHIHSVLTTRMIMLDVIIAMCPALIASVIIFGLRALLVVAVTVAACVGFEYLWNRIMHQPQTIGDLSAIITGMLLAFNMPVDIPLYMPIIGSLAAIIMTKALFGGLGHNFANPAIVGRIVLAVSFPAYMASVVVPKAFQACDAISAATPLAVIDEEIPFMDLFLGTHGGMVGETCSLALLIGFGWLLYTHIIEATIPLIFVGVVAVMSLLCGHNPINEIFSGGLLLGAIFMATDYTTSPFNRKGKIIFAIGCGLITAVIRFWGNMNEGVSYSILLMNLLVPFINEKTRRKPVGGVKR